MRGDSNCSELVERRPHRLNDTIDLIVVKVSVDRQAHDFTRELLQNRKVGRAAFDAATARFGQRGVMTLTNLIACYATLAYNMNTYELEAPAHATEKPLS